MEKVNLFRLKKQYEKENKKGAINTYLTMIGGYEGVINEFGSLKSFGKYLKNLGYSRSYIHRIKKALGGKKIEK